MKCPIDSVDLVMSERQGVEIDYCPTCRGVWLDRGELDKILDRAADVAPVATHPVPRPDDTDRGYRPEPRGDQYRGDQYRPDQYRGDQRYPYKKKKESWLSDILDFG